MEKHKGLSQMDYLPLQLRQDVKKWYIANTNAYRKFYRLFERMRDFDGTFVKKLFSFIEDCIPQELIDVFKYIEDISDESKYDNLKIPYLVEMYDTYVEKCLEGTHTITIDMATQEIHCVSNNDLKDAVRDSMLIVNIYVLEAVTTPVSKRHKAFLNSLLKELIDSTEVKEENKCGETEMGSRDVLKMLAYGAFVYIAICAPKFIDNCRNKSTRHRNLSFCLLYFLIYDKGCTQCVQMLIDNINKVDSLGPEYHYMKELAIKSMVNVSVSKGYEKKDFWKEIASKQVDIDDEDAINNALTHIKEKKGRKPENRILEELLIGDKLNLLTAIEKFIGDKTNDTIDLACLFHVLDKTEHIKCGYETFHEAICAYADKGRFGVATPPQTQYKELKSEEKALYDDKYYEEKDNLHGKKWRRMRKVYAKWYPVFHRIK